MRRVVALFTLIFVGWPLAAQSGQLVTPEHPGIRGLTCAQQLADLELQYKQLCRQFGAPPPDCAKGCSNPSESCSETCDDCRTIAEQMGHKRQECSDY